MMHQLLFSALPCMTVHLDLNLQPVCLPAVVLTTACQSPAPELTLTLLAGIIPPYRHLGCLLSGQLLVHIASRRRGGEQKSPFSTLGCESTWGVWPETDDLGEDGAAGVVFN